MLCESDSFVLVLPTYQRYLEGDKADWNLGLLQA